MSEKQKDIFDNNLKQLITSYLKCETKKADKNLIKDGKMTQEGRVPSQKFLEAQATLVVNDYCKQHKDDFMLLDQTPKFNGKSTHRCHSVGCASKTANHLVYCKSLFIISLFCLQRFHILKPVLWVMPLATTVGKHSTNMRRKCIAQEKRSPIAATTAKPTHLLCREK
jgi:hypothetical protein